MPNIKLFIGSELTDFNEVFNVMFSIGDIRDLSFGSNNKTYTLNLPLTKTNKRLLKFISQPDVKSEPSAIGRLYIGEQLIIQGSILITKYTTLFAGIIINSDDWIDDLKDKKLSDLDLSAYDHTLNHANVEDSWANPDTFCRYPMINFGALVSGESGPTAKWSPVDFIQMFSIKQLIQKIFATRTVVSAWLTYAFVVDLYILGKETIANDNFIQGKGLNKQVQTATDNQISDTINNAETKSMGFGEANIDLNVGTDEGADYSSANNWYVVPETGTYNFTFVARPVTTTFAGIMINSQQHIIAIKRTRGAATVTLVSQTTNFVSTDIFGITYTINTGYVHLEAGDKVFATYYMIQNLTNSGVLRTITMNYSVTTTALSLIWNKVGLYSGLNKDISVAELMPDMTQVDFLTAIRSIFNLRFWFDKSKQVLYIEPWDQFLSSTVVDLTDFIDFESIDTELISPNYNKKITLKWKDDTSDFAYNEYLKTAVSPGMKDIALTSLFTKSGIDIKEHPFSSIINGYDVIISNYFNIPKIFKEEIIPGAMVFDRLVGFNTRIVHWDGLTSGFTWYYDSDTKTQYPKISGLDFATIYSDYWQKLFHYIDKGKLFTVRMKVKPMFLTQFFTVISNSNNEGFRPTYQINNDYYFLQKVTTDGISAELELVLKV